ncbi:MAG TPA: methyltransferase domain-containing protein [Solirubrobacteraceae bacterium]|nr:methyltransferase domain-containing protein [Solirubrobacteraceae bacterium]
MRRLAILAALGIAGGALWWRRRAPLRAVRALDPRPGERVLVVGAGRHALAVARRVAPGGTLELVDPRREALDDVLRRAAEEGIEGVVATQADPLALPFADASVDAAAAVGEHDARELRRVVRPGGRVVGGI